MPFFSGFHLWLCLMKCKTCHFNIKIVICNQRYIILFSGQTLITTVQLHWCPKVGMPTKYYLPVINSVKFLGKWYCGVKIISMGKHARRGPDYIKNWTEQTVTWRNKPQGWQSRCLAKHAQSKPGLSAGDHRAGVTRDRRGPETGASSAVVTRMQLWLFNHLFVAQGQTDAKRSWTPSPA